MGGSEGLQRRSAVLAKLPPSSGDGQKDYSAGRRGRRGLLSWKKDEEAFFLFFERRKGNRRKITGALQEKKAVVLSTGWG